MFPVCSKDEPIRRCPTTSKIVAPCFSASARNCAASSRATWENNGRPEHLRAACEGSLRRLKLERIDIYQLHAPEAYNPWGGYNLYFGPSGTRSDRAYAVSYNRPIAMNSTVNGVGPQDFLFGEEYAAIYWLEQNGYNVSYISGIDAATNAGLLRNTKAYIDVGHDEYWSQSQFANVKAAADAGIDLAFLSGNQIYWDTALAPSFDSSHTANRTVVEYKDIWSGTQLDPNGTSNGGAGIFRDPVYGPGTPENSLSGTIFTVDGMVGRPLDNISIPAIMSQLRFWRNTSIASGNGGTLTGLLGFEWDSDLDNGFRPTGLIDL